MRFVLLLHAVPSSCVSLSSCVTSARPTMASWSHFNKLLKEAFQHSVIKKENAPFACSSAAVADSDDYINRFTTLCRLAL